jgi:GxxExxY protein
MSTSSVAVAGRELPSDPCMARAIDLLKGQARHVMHCLGKGHREAIYHSALITALNRNKVTHRSEVPCPIWFMGECRADLVSEDLIVEIKANRLPPSETSAQLQKYLQSLSKAEHRVFRGVVLNFNQKTGLVDVLEECMLQRRPQVMASVNTLAPGGSTAVRSRFFAAREDVPDASPEGGECSDVMLPAFPGKRRRIERRCLCCSGH